MSISPRLLSATNRIIDDKETDEDLQLILAPGTSLGGARPKASVRDKDGHLLIAKFPRKDNEWPVTRWEAATMALAEAAGVEVSPWRLQLVLKKPVLMARRFDRREGHRIPYMSALTALEASDNEPRSYLEIAEFLRREGSRVNEDLRQLWRRIVFNMLVSNTDDHLRNHGFLRDPNGWRLAPAYDLNPMPTDVKPRIHALAIDEFDGTASLDGLPDCADVRDDRKGHPHHSDGGRIGGRGLARCRGPLRHYLGEDRTHGQCLRSRGSKSSDVKPDDRQVDSKRSRPSPILCPDAPSKGYRWPKAK